MNEVRGPYMFKSKTNTNLLIGLFKILLSLVAKTISSAPKQTIRKIASIFQESICS